MQLQRLMKTGAAIALLIGAPLAAGAIGAIASVNAPSFYTGLNQPSWAPPPSVFGPVWTALYLLMGIAAFLVWRTRGWEGARGALTLFLVQLVFNAIWSWLFFHWRLGTASCADIVVLLILVAALTVWFLRIRPLAGALLVPYAAWVTFATALNFSIVRMNPAMFR